MDTKYTLRKITEQDDAAIAQIVRTNLKAYKLDVPGTVYFDPELNHLSAFYNAEENTRDYYIFTDGVKVLGGIGFAAFEAEPGWAELQKLYLADEVKGNGFGKLLVRTIEEKAKESGYTYMYLETHTNLDKALNLYERMGFQQIDRPASVNHSTMNRFYLKKL
ncbi:MAG: GNAT family N-acetyltransferase [Sphaerochaetaceae bacterium]|nr:GNAT family N-acetyltransferase [Sphaerochaetaceae bacterium]